MTKLKPGDPAPHFTAEDQDGRARRLEEFRGNWVLLYFYPRDNTPGCTAEACSLRDNFEALKKFVTVVGISADSVKSHAAFVAKHGLPFTLLADPKHDVISRYGANGVLFPKRTSFLIDPDGIIVKVYEKVKPTEHADELLADFVDLIDTISKHP